MGSVSNCLCSVEIEHDDCRFNPVLAAEQAIAISDIVAGNKFELLGRESGPYRLKLSTRNSRFTLAIATAEGVPIVSHSLSLTPLRRVIEDYVAIYESHSRMARTGDHYRIEAVDMGRRAIHNEGSELLMDRLSRWIETDRNTARRLFTLIATPYLMSVETLA